MSKSFEEQFDTHIVQEMQKLPAEVNAALSAKPSRLRQHVTLEEMGGLTKESVEAVFKQSRVRMKEQCLWDDVKENEDGVKMSIAALSCPCSKCSPQS